MEKIVSVSELTDDIQETLSAIGAHENIEHIIKDEPDHDFIVTVDPCEDANEYFVIEEYEEPSEAIEHPSVGGCKEEFIERLQNTEQCYLCTDKAFLWRPRLEQHFMKAHMQNSISLAGRLVVSCRLGCKKDAHYHCPHAECLFSCKHQHRLRLHYNLNHELNTGSDVALSLLQEGADDEVSIKLQIKEEPNDYEDAIIGRDMDDKILTEIYGDEDEMADVHPAKMSETLKGVNDMYQEDLDEEGKNRFLSILKQPSEKPSIGHSREELMSKLRSPYCYLCQDLRLPVKSRLIRHFAQLHLGHHVKIANFFIAACKLDCSRFTLVHYHCPYPNCLATVKVKSRLLGHFKKHLDYIHLGHKVSTNLPMRDVIQNKLKKSLLLNEKVNFPPPKKVFDFNGVPYTEHESIGSNPAEMFDKLCLPYCYLCDGNKEFLRMPRLERHFQLAHLNRAVDCGSCYLIQCGLHCLEGNSSHKHYHCPFCPLKDPRRCAFWIHLEAHRREGPVAMQIKKIKKEIDIKSEICDLAPTDAPVVTISLSDEREGEATAITTSETPTKPWNEIFHGLLVRKVPGINTSAEAVLSVARLPYCYLCNDDKDYISQRRLMAHITRCHIKPSFTMEQLLILLCKRYCEDKHQDRGHFHCLLCGFTGRQKQRVAIHIMKHIRMIKKRTDTAEYNLPQVMEDHSVPEEWIVPENKDDVREWENTFNQYVTGVYAKKARTNNNVMTERKKCLIYNHTRHGMDIEDKSLKYWARFRGVKVLSCGQLGLHNVLVMPLTKYNNDEENRAINVQPEPETDGDDLILTSTNLEQEFFQCYRLIPTKEELFKLLYQMHTMNSNHPAPKIMFGEIRRKYLYFPRALVDKFVSLCPACCVHFPDKSNCTAPLITVHNADTINLAALQVTVVDMTEHPDGDYQFVVECFDRCSRLTWLIPTERAIPTDLAETVIRSVLSVTGLPSLIVTNCGYDFLEKMLAEIDRRWFGSCIELISNSRHASGALNVMGSDDLMEALRELVCQQPTSWASALPHLNFRLNHTRGHQAQDQSAFELVFGRQRSRPTWQRFLNNTSTPQQDSNNCADDVEEYVESED